MSDMIISGARAVEEALAGSQGINRIYFAKGVCVQRHDEIHDAAKAAGARIDYIPLAKMNSFAKGSDHQGVAAVLSPVRYQGLKETLATLPPKALVLVLDEVQHARNVGMLIRSAAGAGAAAVVLPRKGGALVDPTVVRASAGTVFQIPLVTTGNIGQALRTLREHEFWCYGLAADGPTSLFAMEWPARVALVIGNETHGMRPVVQKNCDALLSIPLADGVESLNAAIAGSVALFQAAGRTR